MKYAEVLKCETYLERFTGGGMLWRVVQLEISLLRSRPTVYVYFHFHCHCLCTAMTNMVSWITRICYCKLSLILFVTHTVSIRMP